MERLNWMASCVVYGSSWVSWVVMWVVWFWGSMSMMLIYKQLN